MDPWTDEPLEDAGGQDPMRLAMTRATPWPRPQVVSTSNPEPKVKIGERWVPQHVVRFDTLAGTYEEINSPMRTDTERKIQMALLKPARPWL